MNNDETYNKLFEKIKGLALTDDKIRAAVLFGSRARSKKPADAYSDYDFIFFVRNLNCFINTDGWLNGIGDFSISFTEPTAAGGYERRVFFDDACDIDFTFFDAKNAESITNDPIIKSWYARGYRIIADKVQYTDIAKNAMLKQPKSADLTEKEFDNLAETFFFHVIWAQKKLLRGEIWAAKYCIDSYMKALLGKMLEYRIKAQSDDDFDTWHDGRFMDDWLTDADKESLNSSYGGYEKSSLEKALRNTLTMFSTASREVAEKLNFKYPQKAEDYAVSELKRLV